MRGQSGEELGEPEGLEFGDWEVEGPRPRGTLRATPKVLGFHLSARTAIRELEEK